MLIPPRDQALAYAGTIRLHFKEFEEYVIARLGDVKGEAALANLSVNAKLVWQAYAFGAPLGAKFNPADHYPRIMRI